MIAPAVPAPITMCLPIAPQSSYPKARRKAAKGDRHGGSHMAGRIDARLKELDIELPDIQAPWANYVSVLASGDLLYLSGQLPSLNGQTIKGKLGADLTVDQGR